MYLGYTLGNVFSLDRRRTRFGSERVNAEVEEPPGGAAAVDVAASNSSEHIREAVDLESGRTVDGGGGDGDPANRSSSASSTSAAGRRSSASRSSRRPNSTGNSNNANNRNAHDDDEEEDDTLGTYPTGVDDSVDRLFAIAARDLEREEGNNTITLSELEEQRELSRRRSSACVLLAVFVLFRLWIECLQTQDPTLLLLCLLGTSWTARWIRYNREREEELDRRIENYVQNNNNNGGDGGRGVVDRNEYARLSFQAQLALAIMESQRHMMEGGYGRPDGLEEQSRGVSDQAKARWKKFQWKQPTQLVADKNSTTTKKGDYGALPNSSNNALPHDMDNHCSICLGEYEDLEILTKLPCQHIYHDECIQSWTSNHVKCPLCNMDLDSAATGGENEV